MVAEGVLLGPFVGGLNTASDPASVQDNDVTICQNMEMDLDGALRNRYPFEPSLATMTSGVTGNMNILGIYAGPSGEHYLIGSNGSNSTYYFNGTSWVSMTSALAAVAMTQYKGKAWLLADPAGTQSSGSWDPTSGFAVVPGMPKGKTITSNKERLWVGPGAGVATLGAQVMYSEVGAPTRWPNTPTTPGGGYFNVQDGDGQNIINIVVYFSDILIFKERSTYRFVYNTNPATATLTRLSDSIGSSGPNCVISYEGLLYNLYDDKVYSLTNYNFDRVNIKVPMRSSNPSASLADAFSLSMWDDRLVVCYYTDTYVFNTRTGTWCTYASSRVGSIGRFIPYPSSATEVARAYVVSNQTRDFKLYRTSAEETTVSEPMDCIVRTKHFDYQSPGTFKKLSFWGADVFSKVSVTGYVNPVVYAVPVSWNDMKTTHWDDAGTWDRPKDVVISIEDTATIQSVVAERKFIKYLKALRFRLIFFQIKFVTDGSLTQAPVKLFTFTTYVADKQHVVKKVS